MDLKDIILLVVPILMNGFFIFIFQSWISNKIAQKKRENDFTYNIIKQYYEMLQSINNICNELIRESHQIDSEDLSYKFFSIADGIWKAREYMSSNAYDLESLKETYLIVEQAWNKIVNLSNKQGFMEEYVFKNELSILFNDFQKVLVDSINKVRKEMKSLS